MILGHLGCQNKAKIDFEASDGTHGSPRGLPESPRVAFWLIWDRFRCIWGAKLEPKIGLGASGGSHGSPKGPQGDPWEPKGAILVDFWGHFGVIFEVKIMSKSMSKNIVFSSMDFVRFWGVSGCIFVSLFDHFGMAKCSNM